LADDRVPRFELGWCQPQSVEILSRSEQSDSLRGVSSLKQLIEPKDPTPHELLAAFRRIQEAEWAEVDPDRIAEVLVVAVPKSLKVGSVAATTASLDKEPRMPPRTASGEADAPSADQRPAPNLSL
jgi:hypothetical protein